MTEEETELDLEQQCKEMAIVSATEGLEKAWPKMWKSRDRVAKGKDKLEYGIGLSVKIKTEGNSGIEADVGCEVSWSEKQTVKLLDKKVSLERDLFAPDPKSEEDKMDQDAWDIMRAQGRTSLGMIQRRMKLGSTVAGAIMDRLEKRGLIGPPRGSDPREILKPEEESATSEPRTDG